MIARSGNYVTKSCPLLSLCASEQIIVSRCPGSGVHHQVWCSGVHGQEARCVWLDFCAQVCKARCVCGWVSVLRLVCLGVHDQVSKVRCAPDRCAELCFCIFRGSWMLRGGVSSSVCVCTWCTAGCSWSTSVCRGAVPRCVLCHVPPRCDLCCVLPRCVLGSVLPRCVLWPPWGVCALCPRVPRCSPGFWGAGECLGWGQLRSWSCCHTAPRAGHVFLRNSRLRAPE